MILTFRAVPRLETPSIWPEAWEILQAAYRRPGLAGLFDSGDVLSRLTDARAQLWVAETENRMTTACITQIEQYPRGKICRIVAIAGDGHGLWRDWFTEIARWARNEGCQFVRGEGRSGWERIMADAGLKRLGSVYSMETTDG